ncbi:hypothetical protein [Agromyces sp. Soil535]|uniref:hypothetical protein n=1 Tax=Agromyces sp. Soil535 TaxID=1736390 RepID=UPI000A9F5077|nr:hypothetical protein [Agromyces sp. Soil535]
MSEGSAARIDPRFDPQFQRGYVAAEAGGPHASDASPDPGAPTPATSPAEADGADAERAAPADPRGESDAEVASWLDEPESDPPSADPWFLGAWTVSALAFALGATLVVAGIMSESYYGASGESERWLQIVGWTVAPSLMQGGLLGIVVMIVWTGLRHARRTETDAEVPS